MPNEGATEESGAEDADWRPGQHQFWGTHAHNIDGKGRVILPAKFREPFKSGAFITKMAEGCLAVWTPDDFQSRTAAIRGKGAGHEARNLIRSWAANATDATPDAQGRMPIPTHLRTFARLDGAVVVNGNIDHLEIWNASKWDEIDAEASANLLSGTDVLDDFDY